ncbi:hypothetical protein BC567DRAFT_101244 [Phyllosticta citribraziliensis]
MDEKDDDVADMLLDGQFSFLCFLCRLLDTLVSWRAEGGPLEAIVAASGPLSTTFLSSHSPFQVEKNKIKSSFPKPLPTQSASRVLPNDHLFHRHVGVRSPSRWAVAPPRKTRDRRRRRLAQGVRLSTQSPATAKALANWHYPHRVADMSGRPDEDTWHAKSVELRMVDRLRLVPVLRRERGRCQAAADVA